MQISKAHLELADWWVPVYLAQAQGSWLPGDGDERETETERERETGAGGLAVKLYHPLLWAAHTHPHPTPWPLGRSASSF